MRGRKVWAHFQGSPSPTPGQGFSRALGKYKRRCRCSRSRSRGWQRMAGAHGSGHGRGSKSSSSSSCQSLTDVLGGTFCQPACLPSEAIGDQAGTARLGGEEPKEAAGVPMGLFLQGSTAPFPLAFLPSFLSRAYSLSRFGTSKYQAVCFQLRSVDSRQLELNHVRTRITKRVVTMNSYPSHADSDFCRAVSPQKPNLLDCVHSGGRPSAWLDWNGGADHVSKTNLSSRWTACLH